MNRRNIAVIGLLVPLLTAIFAPSAARSDLTDASILFACAVGLTLAWWARSHSESVRRSPLLVPAIMSCAFMASFIWQTPTPAGWSTAIGFVALLSCGAALSELIDHPEGRINLLRCLLTAMAVLSLHAIAQRAYLLGWLHEAAESLHPEVFSNEATPFLQSQRARSTFGQANGLGAACALTLPLALAMRRTGIAVLIAAALISSESAGGLLASTVGVSLYLTGLPTRQHRRLGWIVVGVGALGAGLLVMNLLGWMHAEWLSRPARTAAMRIDYWSAALRAVADSWPSGIGLGVYEATADRYSTPTQSFSRLPHNAYLGWVVEMGWLGGVMVALVLGSVIRAFVRSKAEQHSPRQQPFSPMVPLVAALALAVLLGIEGRIALFFVPFDSPFLHRSAAFILPLGMLFVISTRLGRHNSHPDYDLNIRHAARAGLAAVCLHAAFDIDYHVSGVVALAAIAWALLGREPSQSKTRHEPLLFTAITAGLALWGAAVCLTMKG